MEVRDLLLSPPTSLPYTTLKATLIRRTSESDTSKLQQLLSTADLGDQKPSQLLRHMERLVGAKTIDKGLFRQLFLQRLPRNVVMVLEATHASVDLKTQAEIADKLMELNGPSSTFGHHNVGAVAVPPAAPSVSADIAALRTEVAALTQSLQQLRSSAPDGRRPSFRGSRSRCRQRGDTNAPVCYYHRRFGDSARKCTRPCAYSSATSTATDMEPSGNATARN